MKTMHWSAILICLLMALAAGQAQERLDSLQAGGETYKGVTITGVTSTHLQFLHSRGSASVKLQDLSPELQERFGYKSPTSQKPATAAKPQAKPASKPAAAKPAVSEDIVVPELHAKSFRGSRPPRFEAENWLGSAPPTQGKFVLIDFWATWCGPCRASIPHLNQLQSKFKDKLVVIGLTDEPLATVKAMKSPKIEYAVASDTKGRMLKAAEVKGIPHAMLIDPSGIVRFEGMPNYLDEKGLGRLLDKYAGQPAK